jgi:hypothetical protein
VDLSNHQIETPSGAWIRIRSQWVGGSFLAGGIVEEHVQERGDQRVSKEWSGEQERDIGVLEKVKAIELTDLDQIQKEIHFGKRKTEVEKEPRS